MKECVKNRVLENVLLAFLIRKLDHYLSNLCFVQLMKLCGENDLIFVAAFVFCLQDPNWRILGPV